MMRKEYPRPQLVRKEWESLNGKWSFDFDDENKGIKEQWFKPEKSLSQTINVPFAYQTSLSGIDIRDPHDYMWYKRSFTLPQSWKGQEILLHFGAVDYHSKVYINGLFAGENQGGSIGYSLNITPWLKEGENQLALWVYDPNDDETIPRGKQSWTGASHGIWYTNTSGIWQSVWLEPVAKNRVESFRVTSNIERGLAEIEFLFAEKLKEATLKVRVSFKGEEVAQLSQKVRGYSALMVVDVFENKTFRYSYHGNSWCWSPETPNLFDLEVEVVVNGKVEDEITSYFGMRKIHTKDGTVYLNNAPYYQKLVLDQGYWPEGLLTAPSDEAFVKDIEICKEMGFNGVRKHQKIEDPRFLYWADKLGFLVWGEIPSAPAFNHQAVKRIMDEFTREIQRDYNHPSIVAWVPINESWGVMQIEDCPMQQSHSAAMYHVVKSLDNTRLVISNDGWQLTITDICAIHNYRHGNPGEEAKQADFIKSVSSMDYVLGAQHSSRAIFVPGYKYEGQPIMLTEYGGIGFAINDQGWGYTTVNSAEAFIEEFARVTKTLYQSPILSGFCYTQLSDVEQEINGLVTYDRKPKADFAKIREINEGWHPSVAVVKK